SSVTDQSQGERGHLSHFWIGIRQELLKRLDGVLEAHSPYRQSCASAHPRFIIGKQPDQIGGRRRWRRRNDRHLLADGRRGRWWRRRWWCRIAERALIFEPKNPRHLLLEGGGDRFDDGRGRRRARTGERTQGQQQ